MLWEAKEQVVKGGIDVLAKLFDHPLSGIGNIFPREKSPSVPSVGRIMSASFFWDDYDVQHGPFTSSHDWLAARLSLVLQHSAEVLRTSENKNDIEEAQASQALAEGLLRLLQTISSPHVAAPEPTVITHDDLSFHNILVSHQGSLTGIIDWECVSALPLWKACQLPSSKGQTLQSARRQPSTRKKTAPRTKNTLRTFSSGRRPSYVRSSSMRWST